MLDVLAVLVSLGVNVCTLMNIMSERLLPSACEVDITGVVSMYALQLASNSPSAPVDWNNNYGSDPGLVRALPLWELGQGLYPRRRYSDGAHPRHDAG